MLLLQSRIADACRVACEFDRRLRSLFQEALRPRGFEKAINVFLKDLRDMSCVEIELCFTLSDLDPPSRREAAASLCLSGWRPAFSLPRTTEPSQPP